MNKVDLCLTNGKILAQNSILEAGIAIDKGRIVSISKNSLLPQADKVIDVEGSIILPGIIDTHVHFRDPGLTQKENFSTGSKAAAAGGVTTICDMPNTSPPTDSLKEFKEKREIGNRKSYVDFGLHGMLTESQEEGRKIMNAGAVSLKLYPESCEDSEVSKFQDDEMIITVHPEDPSLIENVETWEGADDFIKSRPNMAETSEIIRLLSLVQKPHVHYCHISTKGALDHIAKEKSRREISCEVAPHHLLLDRSHLREFGPVAKTYPPLRTKKDRQTLLRGLERGSIDIVATDHAPHTFEEKNKGLKEAPPGIAGIETSLPLLFTLVKKKKLSPFRLKEAMSSYPAKIFGLRNEENIPKGVLSPGADADIVVLDQNRKWEIKGEDLHGKTKFTPFEGTKVIGKPTLTLVRGKIVFKEGEIVGEKGYGRFLPRRT
ncbi:hypothetical protein AKJ37_01305 [candidate division MSBL1 archaeon SCGC-AAA259I09]|uniref:Dihydroorotase n=1 Tax=candidate division MSBL1 archaeon SCGC-AAA259I09 TaxID=1698267 RepID=A0A133UVE7_9EURY|nr:hypothetical protein AKJ37_01305 [candidate division MSBL1 archaeon SCGC-AAA259I09]